MARWNDLPWREEVYRAADLWKNRCLMANTSLTGDPDVWTLDNLRELQRRISDNPDWSKQTFEQKLFRQLDGATDDVVHLASDIVWLIYLFPLGKEVNGVLPVIKASTKFKRIAKIRGRAGLLLPSGDAFTADALCGVGRSGMFFKRYFHAIRYLLVVFTKFKQLSRSRQAELLAADNAWQFARWSDQFRQETQVPMRHALMFFLFPDNFERIVSLSHKKAIVTDLSRKLTAKQLKAFFDLGDFGSLLAIDQAIFGIRKHLEQATGTAALDFYSDPHRQWLERLKHPKLSSGAP